jgi:hypothetical protein
VKYAFISQNRRHAGQKQGWPVKIMCWTLQVSVAGWQRHMCQERRQEKRPAAGRLRDAALLVHIRSIHQQ